MKTLIKILFHLLTPDRLSAKYCGVIQLKTEMLPSLMDISATKKRPMPTRSYMIARLFRAFFSLPLWQVILGLIVFAWWVYLMGKIATS